MEKYKGILTQCIIILAIALFSSKFVNAQWLLDRKAMIGMHNTPLRDFLDMIEQNTGYKCIIEGGILYCTTPITMNYESCALRGILDSAFVRQPYRYFIAGSYIVIAKKEGICFDEWEHPFLNDTNLREFHHD